VTNVVFMGMGEPMLNLSAVKEGITILTDPNKLGLGQRRITVSTSGYLPQLTEFIQAGFRGRLAISLHAPTQELREELMPTVAKVFPLDKLLEKLDEFTTLTNKRISYEYILIKEVNDKFEHAGELVRLFRDRLAHINLIPYNAIADSEFVTPERERVLKFRDILADAGIPVTVRVSMGADVAGACGQLTDVQPAEFANLV
jgi:23S rRNA (adenine2503-C2)-methyltransferase